MTVPVADDLSAPGHHQQLGVNPAQIIEALKADLNVLSAFAAPDVHKFDFPDEYVAIWNHLVTKAQDFEGFAQFALGLPRGFVKTDLLKLLVLYIILFTSRRFILVVGATEGHASNFISDVADMLGSPNVVAVFGNWRAGAKTDTKVLKQFVFRGRTIVLGGIGEGGSPRGFNLGRTRPDVIIMDDVQTKENAASETLSANLLSWIVGTLMKTKHQSRCLTIFLGNMYPYPEGCILEKLRKAKSWVSLIVGAILSDGQSLWPQLRSLESLIAEYESDLELGQAHVFMAEVMNDIHSGTLAHIDISKIPLNPYVSEADIPQGRFIVIDPSRGKITSDAQVVTLFEVFDARPVAVDIVAGSSSPLELIRTALTLAIRANCPLIVVEDVAYQETLIYWFNYFITQFRITGITMVPVAPGGFSKNARILTMLKGLLAGELYLHETVRAQVIHQIIHFDPKVTTNADDILDTLAYARKVWMLYGHLAIPALMGTGFMASSSTESLLTLPTDGEIVNF